MIQTFTEASVWADADAVCDAGYGLRSAETDQYAEGPAALGLGHAGRVDRPGHPGRSRPVRGREAYLSFGLEDSRTTDECRPATGQHNLLAGGQ